MSVHVTAWCPQAKCRSLNWCWPRSRPPCDIPGPQWVSDNIHIKNHSCTACWDSGKFEIIPPFTLWMHLFVVWCSYVESLGNSSPMTCWLASRAFRPDIYRETHCWLATHISMAWCKTAVTPLLTHWSYCSLALSLWFASMNMVNCVMFDSDNGLCPVPGAVTTYCSLSVFMKNHRTHQTFPMAWRKCPTRDFTNLNKIYKAHRINVWWAMKVFRLHCPALWNKFREILIQINQDCFVSRKCFLENDSYFVQASMF